MTCPCICVLYLNIYVLCVLTTTLRMCICPSSLCNWGGGSVQLFTSLNGLHSKSMRVFYGIKFLLKVLIVTFQEINKNIQ